MQSLSLVSRGGVAARKLVVRRETTTDNEERARLTPLVVASTTAMMVVRGREEEKREKIFPFSKPKGVVLVKETIFFLETRRNMITFGCWKKEKITFFL